MRHYPQISILFVCIAASAASLSVPAVAKTECNSWLLGICIGHNTPAEQAAIDANRQLKIILEDPVQAPSILDRRLRQLIHYVNGVILIEDPFSHSITTVRANAPWSIVCDPDGSIEVVFRSVTIGNVASSEEDLITKGQINGIGVELIPFEVIGTVKFDKNYCSGISASLGQAVLPLTSGH
jgi:hypothetical protein